MVRERLTFACRDSSERESDSFRTTNSDPKFADDSAMAPEPLGTPDGSAGAPTGRRSRVPFPVVIRASPWNSARGVDGSLASDR